MTDHYSGHDPERGCGLMIVAGIGVLIFLLLLALLTTIIPRVADSILQVMP